jgi:hypothetical protein
MESPDRLGNIEVICQPEYLSCVSHPLTHSVLLVYSDFLHGVHGNGAGHCLIHSVEILGILKETRRANCVTSCCLIKV